ncbi:hypothetical protein DYBT9275_04541 [Dyadobacter sp. CECT 9275]|uniref:6-phosphogluconate dehydrogenase n=1 Tax=Dyadobacter helix TaxID=2822344 RepID=A0A916JFG4_9BACT|nr:hypothetical protein [Dyadobacter sp. CECT 9275]CAG5009643.1 hypothetical protein DYBT9275_04541 [Dyadobacter sp. CECT 9275]
MRKWLILFIFLAIIFGILYYITFGYYSEGKRGGYVNKISKKGYLFKTFEGELRIGGIYEGDGTMNASEWSFSVSNSNKEAIANLEEAIKNGSRVSLTYEEKFFTLPWNGDTKYFVTKVEVLHNSRSAFPPAQQLPAPTEIDTNSVL